MAFLSKKTTCNEKQNVEPRRKFGKRHDIHIQNHGSLRKKGIRKAGIRKHRPKPTNRRRPGTRREHNSSHALPWCRAWAKVGVRRLPHIRKHKAKVATGNTRDLRNRNDGNNSLRLGTHGIGHNPDKEIEQKERGRVTAPFSYITANCGQSHQPQDQQDIHPNHPLWKLSHNHDRTDDAEQGQDAHRHTYRNILQLTVILHKIPSKKSIYSSNDSLLRTTVFIQDSRPNQCIARVLTGSTLVEHIPFAQFLPVLTELVRERHLVCLNLFRRVHPFHPISILLLR